MQAGAGLTQQVQAVVQQLGAGSRVQVLQLLHRDLRLHVHDAQDERRVLNLRKGKLSSVENDSHTGTKEPCSIRVAAAGGYHGRPADQDSPCGALSLGFTVFEASQNLAWELFLFQRQFAFFGFWLWSFQRLNMCQKRHARPGVHAVERVEMSESSEGDCR